MGWIVIALAAAIMLWLASLWRVLYSSFPCLPSNPPFLASSSGKKRRNVLLVVAHPDDESLFFAPTILFLNSEGHSIHILCMSTGNAVGIGNIRKEEFYRACAVLKVPIQQVKVLDHPSLQDGFDKPWDHHLLARLVENEIRAWNIDSLITFDKYGVSSHPNHRDVHHGINMLIGGNLHQQFEAWELVSRSIFRKYVGPVDVWLLILCSLSYPRTQRYCLLNNHPWKCYLAMVEHESQLVWFRKLFVLFSSYTYINTLQKINL